MAHIFRQYLSVAGQKKSLAAEDLHIAFDGLEKRPAKTEFETRFDFALGKTAESLYFCLCQKAYQDRTL